MRRSRGDRTPLYAEVNVVSLVDLMMLLMVIFMITAPIMQGGVDLELPKADARPVESREGVKVSILRDGTIYVDQTRVTLSQFRASIAGLTAGKAKDGVYVRADRNARMEVFTQVIAILMNAGITKVAIVAEPEDVSR